MHPGQQDAPPGPGALAGRLRDLRHQWPGIRVTQRMLSSALQVSPSLVSSWESASEPVIPPTDRLWLYATIFATRRSYRDDRLHVVPDAELTPDEGATRDELYAVLLRLRDAAESTAEPTGTPPPRDPAGTPAASAPAPASTWHFPDGAPVRLVCGKLPDQHRGDYAYDTSYNYTELFGYADIDAMVELFGHLRMTNPRSDIRFMLAEDMRSDDLSAHVVLIGGLAWNPAARFYAKMAGLPVQQVDDESVEDGDVFEVERDGRRRRFLPTFLEGDPALGLIEDVALLARMPNPSYPQRTLTICNGIFSRGVYGAVRALTDARVRAANEDYLASRFAGTSEFGLLLRVPVLGGATSTPDLTSNYHRLFVWTGREDTE